MARRNNMRRGGFGSGAIISAIGLTALASIALTLALTSPRGAVGAAFNDAMAATGNVVSAPVRWVSGAGDWFSSIFAGSGEIQKLRRENEALLEWRDQARAMAERLDAYETLHNVQSEITQGGVSARLVSESSGPFSRAGLINAGSNQGVRLNWVVVNQYGLVGRVISVGKDSARILMLSDSASKIAIMGEVSRARAILIGDKSDAPYLAPLNTPSIIAEGERLVTSGDDGIIPRGIAIGIAGKAPDGKWRARLNTNGRGIDFVRLLPPNNFPPPLERVTLPQLGAPAAPIAGAEGAVLPLSPGAAQIPTTNTPSAIAQAQAARSGTSKKTPEFKVRVVTPETKDNASNNAPNGTITPTQSGTNTDTKDNSSPSNQPQPKDTAPKADTPNAVPN